jgi:hypothetical protein
MTDEEEAGGGGEGGEGGEEEVTDLSSRYVIEYNEKVCAMRVSLIASHSPRHLPSLYSLVVDLFYSY